MLFSLPSGNNDSKAVLAALSRSLGIIEFDLSGNVLFANENFCKALGYELSEIKGRHHSMFVDPAYARSAEYKGFWSKLGRGEFDAGEYKRLGKGGNEIWIQASYNPVLDARGAPFKVVKVAADITVEKLKAAENQGKLDAARASEAGRGFAVVASEVRALAQRSADAAKEIKGLIHESVDQVEAGVSLVGQTGKSLETIVAEVQDINENVRAIVEAAQRQASSLQEINTAMTAIDQNTQRNAAMVEETTAASHSLGNQADALMELLRAFKLGDHRDAEDDFTPARQSRKASAKPRAALRSVGSLALAPREQADEWREF